MPWESRRMTPICEGVDPFFANLVMWSFTCTIHIAVVSVFPRDYKCAPDPTFLLPYVLKQLSLFPL